jgi:hypothetical protein
MEQAAYQAQIDFLETIDTNKIKVVSDFPLGFRMDCDEEGATTYRQVSK